MHITLTLWTKPHKNISGFDFTLVDCAANQPSIGHTGLTQHLKVLITGSITDMQIMLVKCADNCWSLLVILYNMGMSLLPCPHLKEERTGGTANILFYPWEWHGQIFLSKHLLFFILIVCSRFQYNPSKTVKVGHFTNYLPDQCWI